MTIPTAAKIAIVKIGYQEFAFTNSAEALQLYNCLLGAVPVVHVYLGDYYRKEVPRVEYLVDQEVGLGLRALHHSKVNLIMTEEEYKEKWGKVGPKEGEVEVECTLVAEQAVQLAPARKTASEDLL